jgi:hypothetical protein
MLEMFLKGTRIHNQIVHKIVDELMFEIAKQGIDYTREYLAPNTYPYRQLGKFKKPKGVQKAVALRLLADKAI